MRRIDCYCSVACGNLSSTHPNGMILATMLLRFWTRGNAIAEKLRCLSQLQRRYVTGARGSDRPLVPDP